MDKLLIFLSNFCKSYTATNVQCGNFVEIVLIVFVSETLRGT